MIYTVGGIKGGSGKTTVAVNLSVILSSEKKRDVLLIDADEQETATDFSSWRHDTLGETGYTSIQLSGGAVRTEIQKLKQKYDDIVVDTGGRDTSSQRAALTVSDFYLVPFLPRSFDVWTLTSVQKIVEEVKTVNPKLIVASFLNRADARGSDNDEAAEYIKEECGPNLEFLEAKLCSRKAFSNASSKGLSVIELKPQDKKATEEILGLFEECQNLLAKK